MIIFTKKTDNKNGGGIIHVTTLAALQEKLVEVVKAVRKVTNTPKSHTNHISLLFSINPNTKREPSRFDNLADVSYDITKFTKDYFM